MLQRLKVYAKSPWTWFVLLVIIGVGLSAGAAQRGPTMLRVSDASVALAFSPERSCIPIMELDGHGALTGRVTCATEHQVRTFCEAALKDYEKRKVPPPQ